MTDDALFRKMMIGEHAVSEPDATPTTPQGDAMTERVTAR